MAQEGTPPTRRRPDPSGGAGSPPTRPRHEPAAGGGGRSPGGGPPEGGPPELPPELAGRFEVIGGKPAAEGGEAVVWHVRERQFLRKQELALKIYHRGIRSDARAAAKRRWKSVHLQEIIEAGAADNRRYELTEWLPGGTVADLIGEHRTGLPEPVIRDLVRQLAEALTELHGQQIVHLDVKPANIAIRRPADPPRDMAPPVVLIDFGSAQHIEWRIVDHAGAPRTPAYAAPEIFLDKIAFRSDWWALGITLLELATGHHPLAGMTEQNIAWQITFGDDLSIPDDVDAQVRLLCQGLLVRDPAYRWGADEVRSWLDGEPPDLPEQRGPLVSEHSAFVFDGREHRERMPLAVALEARWSEASHELFAPAGRWPELRDWLAQFGGHGGREAGAEFARRLEQQWQRRLPPEAALLLLIRWLHSGADAIYLGFRVNPVWLPYIAARAMGADVSRRPPGGDDKEDLDQGQAARIVGDLWDHELLPPLDLAPDGAGLAGIDTRWRAYAEDWDRGRRQAAVIHSDLELELQRGRHSTLSAWLLWLAVDPGHEAQLRRMVTAAQREIRALLGQPRARLDWFDEIVQRAVNPAALLVAHLATGSARAEAQRIRHAIDVERATQQAREKSWRQLQLARDWDRSVALGWAAASAAIVATGWFVLLQLMSVFRAAPEVTVSRAWIFASCAALLELVIELSAAAAIGGPYYPRFALMSRIQRAAGRMGRTFSRSGIVASLVASTAALTVIVAVATLLSVVTATVPFLLPLIVVPAHAADAYRRHRDWRSYYNRRRALVREGRAPVTAGAAGGREPTEGDR